MTIHDDDDDFELPVPTQTYKLTWHEYVLFHLFLHLGIVQGGVPRCFLTHFLLDYFHICVYLPLLVSVFFPFFCYKKCLFDVPMMFRGTSIAENKKNKKNKKKEEREREREKEKILGIR